MSFLAKLELDGELYNILEFDISLDQDVDQNDRPSAIARGGRIRMVVESTRSTIFFSWTLSDTQTKDGKIIFYRRDELSQLKTVEFRKAYSINFHESFRASGEIPMKTEFTLTAKEIDYGGTIMEKNWPLTV